MRFNMSTLAALVSIVGFANAAPEINLDGHYGFPCHEDSDCLEILRCNVVVGRGDRYCTFPYNSRDLGSDNTHLNRLPKRVKTRRGEPESDWAKSDWSVACTSDDECESPFVCGTPPSFSTWPHKVCRPWMDVVDSPVVD